MPSRLSRIFLRSDKETGKEKEAEAEAELNRAHSSTSSPPPTYSERPPPSFDENDALDPPDITAGFRDLDQNLSRPTGTIPRVAHCIAHLKLLECFYRVRQTVGATDDLFGISDRAVSGVGIVPADKVPEHLAKLAEKRWSIYVCRAVDRFAAWVTAIHPDAKPITYLEIEQKGVTGELFLEDYRHGSLSFDASNLPPVDVLMVWHAYMLNPRAYLEDCLRLGRMNMWHIGFPWQAIAKAISADTFLYEASAEAQESFAQLTGLPWDNLADTEPKVLKCPGCGTKGEVPYTTVLGQSWQPSITSLETFTADLDAALASGTGYCDKDFTYQCPVRDVIIDHEVLRAASFRDDLKLLKTQHLPMRGAVLGRKGIPFQYGAIKDPTAKFNTQTLNILLGSSLGDALRDVSKPQKSMGEIRDQIDKLLADSKMRKAMASETGHRMYPAERMAIRGMMSRYWDNSSPFALDLVGAVIRQGSFVEKMHHIDWLHSPALHSTMKRLLVKYTRFVSIMTDRRSMAVPTLDVDLAWHTHQLIPQNYMCYTTDVTDQFIDHDDKVAETKLNDAFAWTSKRYQKLYGEPYSECTCWYCEAVRESHTSPASRLFHTKSSQAAKDLHPTSQDPARSVHISAHNAVRPTDENYTRDAAAKAAKLEAQYQRACDRATKQGRPVPRRNDYYYSDAWGYPVYMPAYSPFVGPMVCCPLYYPANPACMATEPGAVGNCCAGTCAAGGGGACGSGGFVGAGCGNGGGGGACGGGGGGNCGGGGGGGCGGGGGGGCGGGGGGG